MTTTDRLARVALRTLLRAYSPAFRARFGAEFVDFALTRRADVAGASATLLFWASLVVDVARTALPDRLLARSGAHRYEPSPPEDIMDTFARDVRFALRSLRRRPGFAAVVAITLALGIGATTAIFSVIDGVLLQRLPWPGADRMALVVGRSPDGSDENGVSYPDFFAMRERAAAFEELGAMRAQSIILSGVERPDRLSGVFATAGVLRLAGASMALGRAFNDAESTIGTRAAVAVLSYETWQSRFGGAPSVVGRVVRLNGEPFTIVGVTAARTQAPFFGTPDVWVPMPYYPNAGGLERGDRSMMVVGRLHAGTSLAAARTQVVALAREAAAEFPATNAGYGANVRDLKAMLVGDAREPLTLVMAAVAVLLLIACLNVANLQLARALARQRETAVRAAIGASRSRLVRQLLTESAVLATLGGALGIAVGVGLMKLLVATVAADLPAYGGIHFSGRVLAVAALATIGSALIVGVLPAWRMGSGVGGGLGTRDALASRATVRARSTLVVGQLALSVTLLAAAGLLDRSLLALQHVDPGFDASRLLTFQFRLPATKYDTPERIRTMFARTLDELRTVPGVRSAALARAVPFEQGAESVPAAFDGQSLDDVAHALQVDVNVVSEGYFATIALPVRRGRDFSARDDDHAPLAVVVSEEFARRVWPNVSPLGRRVRTTTMSDWGEVIGVVPGVKQNTLDEAPRPQMYVTFRQRPMIFTSVVLRTSGDPMQVAEPARRAVWRVDADQPVWKLHPVETSIAASTGGARSLATLTTAFALVALTLAAVGVFGVMSFVVAQRRREMGIRLALGARRDQIAGLVLRSGLRLTGFALVLGLIGTAAMGRAVASQLYGVSSSDPIALGGVAAVLSAVALLACWLPARRAARIDPKASLQAD